MNGFGSQGGPRNPEENPVRYPFKSFDGKVTLDKQKSGERVYDINTDGMAHYGLYPDWIEDLRMIAGDQIVKEMGRGAEAYLQMWERAEGIRPAYRCGAGGEQLHQHVAEAGAAGADGRAATEGAEPPAALARAGVDVLRARAAHAPRERAIAVFNRRGRVKMLLSTAARITRTGRRHMRASGGSRTTASSAAASRWRPPGKGNRFVYGVRDGRIALRGARREGDCAESAASSTATCAWRACARENPGHEAADQPRRPVPRPRDAAPDRPRGRGRDPRPVDGAGRHARRGRHEAAARGAAAAAPAVPVALAEVPFGLDYPYWVDDQDFDLDFHVRELALPAPGQRPAAGRAGGAHLRPPARPRAAAVGAVRDPRPGRPATWPR